MTGNRDQLRLQGARIFDRAALAAVYEENHEPIYRYIYWRVGDVETARDLTADVFHRFLKAVKQGKGPDQNLSAWLYRTAGNMVIDHYRRRKHRQHLPLEEELIDGSSDPAQIAEAGISADRVRAALRELTPDQQQVITLKFLKGFSNEEVAEVLEKPVGAVKSLQHRALAALQRRLSTEKEKVQL